MLCCSEMTNQKSFGHAQTFFKRSVLHSFTSTNTISLSQLKLANKTIKYFYQKLMKSCELKQPLSFCSECRGLTRGKHTPTGGAAFPLLAHSHSTAAIHNATYSISFRTDPNRFSLSLIARKFALVLWNS